MDIGPPELIIALVIVLLLFGGKKLPEIARGLGRAQHEFREGMQRGRARERESNRACDVDADCGGRGAGRRGGESRKVIERGITTA